MIQALMLLQAALALLTLVATTPVPQSLRDEAVLIANRAIVVAREEIAKSQNVVSTSVSTIQVPQQIPRYVSPDQVPTGSVSVEITQPKKMSLLQIFSPIPKKGLNREFRTTSEFNENGENYNEVYIGLICGGSRTESVTVEATDSTQNKTINGTGTVGEVSDDLGQKSKVFYYPYTYQFKTEGDHTITFTCNGESASVTMTVSNPH